MWHNDETIRQVLKEYSNNAPIEELEKKYNCSKRTIERWRSKYKMQKKPYMIALYDLEDNLIWLGTSTKELAKFLGVSTEKVSSSFTPQEMKRKMRYKNSWCTKHKIYI